MIQPYIHSGPAFSGLRIGLLGGSFNPAHAGHLAMSLYALKRLQLDQIWWLVTPQNPLKSSKDMAPLAERMKNARSLARHPRLVVTGLEAALGTCYTVDTLRALRKRFRGTDFVWLMGEDNLRQIPQWRQWQEIFALAPVAVFRRPAYAVNHGMGKAAQRFSKARRPARAAKNLGKQQKLPAWVMLDNQYNSLSGSSLRAMKR